MAEGDWVEVDADQVADAVASIRGVLTNAPITAPVFDVPDLGNAGYELVLTASALVGTLPTALATQFEAICRTVLTTTIAAVEADAVRVDEPFADAWYERCTAE